MMTLAPDMAISFIEGQPVSTKSLLYPLESSHREEALHAESPTTSQVDKPQITANDMA